MIRSIRRSLILSLMLIAVWVAATIAVQPPVRGAGAGSRAAASGTPTPRLGPYALIVVVDGARADEMNLSTMPNLAALAAAGTTYSRAWVGQLPSITETSHATIGTGVFPRRHSILGDTWRIPGTEQMSPDLLDGELVRTGYIGKLMQRAGVPSLAGLVHRRFPGSVVVTLSGHKAYASDAMGAGAADFVAFGGDNSRGHYVPGTEPGREAAPSIMKSPQLDLPAYPRTPGQEDHWATTLALKFLFGYHPRVIMLNLPEVDVTGHLVGTDKAVMQPLMTSVDGEIGRLVAAYQRAGMWAHTTMVVTADHGMVPGTRTVSSGAIHTIITRAGGQILYEGHGDYAPIWLKNAAAIPRVASALAGARLGGVRAVFYRRPSGAFALATSNRSRIPAALERAYGDLLATFDSQEAPDIVLFYDEDTMTMSPEYLKDGRKADHGGATWGAQHIPLYIEGPGIRAGYVSSYPARLVDLAPTVETLLGITPQHQDGVALADAMIAPPPWAVKEQRAAAPAEIRDVEALAPAQPVAKPTPTPKPSR